MNWFSPYDLICYFRGWGEVTLSSFKGAKFLKSYRKFSIVRITMKQELFPYFFNIVFKIKNPEKASS